MAEAVRHSALKVAVGYIRCSTEMQQDSPEQQKKEILQFAAQQGYMISEWFVDFGKSGTTFKQRPEFMKLWNVVAQKPYFQFVICYDEPRWGRAIDAEENTYWRFRFRECGVEVVLVKTSVIQNNEFAPMLAAFEGVQASGYSKKLSELTLRGAKANGMYSNGGTAPYGYIRIAINTKTGHERELQPGEWCVSGQEKVKWALGDPQEFKTVTLIYERRSEGAGYRSIAGELNRTNVPCPKRGRWRNADQKWSDVTIKTIIENPAYYGARRYNCNSMSKIQAKQKGRDLKSAVSYPHWRNEEKDWVIADGAHEPIVSKEVWLKANAFRRVKEPNANRVRHKSPYLLSGLIRCSRCGFTFQGWTGKSRGKPYPRYIDSGWNNKHICAPLMISKDLLESFAIQAVKETISDPTLVKNIEKHLKELVEAQPEAEKSEVEQISSRLERNKEKIGNILESIERGAGGDSLYSRLRELEQDQRVLETRLGQLASEPAQTVNLPEVGKLVTQFLENFEAVFARAPMEDRKELIKKLIQEIIVDREANVVRFYIRSIPPLTPALETLINKQKKPTPGSGVGFSCSGGRT